MATRPYKPIINPVAPFDVNKTCIINFFYIGDPFSYVELWVERHGSDTPGSVRFSEYSRTATSGIYQFVWNNPFETKLSNADSVTNGNIYDFWVTIGYSNGDTSMESTSTLVYTFSTPTFSLDVPSVVDASYLDVQLVYSQSEGERLDNFVVTLYDNKGKEVKTSGERYDTSNLNYTFKNLKNGDAYTLKASGTTVHGMTMNAQADFSVEYSQTQLYTYLTLDNIPEEGAVKISSEIISIVGESYPSPPLYITSPNGQMVDLRNNEHWVRFNKGFNIKDDFLIQCRCTPINGSSSGKEILSIQNGTNRISVICWVDNIYTPTNARLYLELKVYNNLTYYTITSEKFPVVTLSYICNIWIRHYKGVYEIHAVRQ